MKKTLFILIISIFLCSYNASAQNKPQDPCESWHKKHEQIQNSINKNIKISDTKKVKGISDKDYISWEKNSNKVKENYEKLKNNERITTGKNDIQSWEQINDKIYNAIRNGDWPEIGTNDVKTWKKSCDEFKTGYINLLSKNKKGKGSNSSKTPENPSSKPSTGTKNKNSEDLIEASNEAFKLCIYLPLTVKYDEGSTKKAYKIASDLKKTGHMTHENVKTWGLYQNLLLKYGEYNTQVITFIENIQKKLTQKGAKPINVSYYRDVFKEENYEYSKFYNNKAASIIYLDKVLNEFFALLEDYGKRNENPSEKFFRNFIINNLDSNYGQK